MRQASVKIHIILLCLALCILANGCAKDDAAREIPEIAGIYAENVLTEYDGAEHGIAVLNTLSGDRVYYSENGFEWSTENKKYVMPGEYKVYFKVERDGYKSYFGSANVVIERIVLSGIGAKDATYIYDGAKHGIEVSGAEPSDKVTYSSDGEIDVGEYTVFYVVEREYGEYRGECKLTILPRIQGEYVNSENGGIILTEKTAIIGGEEYAMEYGVTGAGKIGNDEFKVDGDILTVNGREYEHVAENEKIYAITVNGRIIYAKGEKSGIEIRIEFDDGKAEIKCGDKTIATEESVNYVENVADRDYTTTNVTLKASDDISIELTEREQNAEEDKYSFVVYDGEFHAMYAAREDILYKVNGAYTAEPPEYKDQGVYETDAVIVKDGYLPKIVHITLEIAANIYGTYYNDSTLIEIAEGATSVNYIEKELTYSDGNWFIDGQKITVTATGIAVAATEYAKQGAESIIAVKTEVGIKILPCESRQYIISFDGASGAVTMTDDSSRTIYEYQTNASSINVFVNGKTLPSIPDEQGSIFIIGSNEIDAGKIVKIEIAEV